MADVVNIEERKIGRGESYTLYVKYTAGAETSLVLSFEVFLDKLQDWFPVESYDVGSDTYILWTTTFTDTGNHRLSTNGSFPTLLCPLSLMAMTESSVRVTKTYTNTTAGNEGTLEWELLPNTPYLRSASTYPSST